MNRKQLFKFALRQIPHSSLNLIQKPALSKQHLHFFIPHQPNIPIIQPPPQPLHLPLQKISKTLHKYPNTSPPSIPISLSQQIQPPKIHHHDLI
ncbi:3-oxoacyl-[acyl-carrier-protein] synthase III C-terminal domain-containing protein, partial [Bacillus altitudinis]|uniref:3-oxoacyl-[acyl-carrier-protein] synthase III C-terminal domain-containing protein n=1 Tax=Bacillus altitudinis TaxID=293387 RepID=UPI003B51C3B1